VELNGKYIVVGWARLGRIEKRRRIVKKGKPNTAMHLLGCVLSAALVTVTSIFHGFLMSLQIVALTRQFSFTFIPVH
jgi:hypothetical protein